MDINASREQILKKLYTAPKTEPTQKIDLEPSNDFLLSKEERITLFTKEILRQTGEVYRVSGYKKAKQKLTQIAIEKQLKSVIISTDDTVQPLELSNWGKDNQIQVQAHTDFPDRKSFKRFVFDQACAGITGADYAISESGTLCLIHNKTQPRLNSIAVILHIVIVQTQNLFAVYEQVIEKIFKDIEQIPSQVSFITGPSMTADIKAKSFRGMHGPKDLIVILID